MPKSHLKGNGLDNSPHGNQPELKNPHSYNSISETLNGNVYAGLKYPLRELRSMFRTVSPSFHSLERTAVQHSLLVVVWMWNVPHRLPCLNTWSQFAALFRGRGWGYRTSRRRDQAWGCMPLGERWWFTAWSHFLFTLCFVTGSKASILLQPAIPSLPSGKKPK